MNIFTKKTVVLTGATSGIGEALAHALAREECTLILIGRNAEKLAHMADTLGCEYHCADVTDDAFHHFLQSKQIDVLINNAGVSQRGAFLDSDARVEHALMQVNYFAVLSACRAVLPHMMAQGDGRIISIGSMAGKMGSPLRAGYAASKHALIGFMDCLRAEVFSCGVKVQVVNPSFVKTNLSANAFAADGGRYGKVDHEIAKGMEPSVFVAKMMAQLKAEKEEINIATGKAKWGDLLHRLNYNWYHKAVRKFYHRHI